MLKTFCVLCILLTTLIAEPFKVNCPTWCKNGVLNTICYRFGCVPAPGCIELPMRKKFRTWLMAAHNILRDQTAARENVANMLALAYSLELEYVAQCWANACKFKNDACRLTPEFQDRVGQNVARKRTVETYAHIAEVVNKWFANGTADTRWAQTSHIGCGMSKMITGFTLIVCNYGVHQQPRSGYGYVHGHTTTMCGKGEKPHYHYSHLCASGAKWFLSSPTICLISIFIVVYNTCIR